MQQLLLEMEHAYMYIYVYMYIHVIYQIPLKKKAIKAATIF
jgi:hypothetical protein